MKTMVISASPNHDGLTAACADAAEAGLRSAGSDVERVNLNDLDIGKCAACERGWGTCRNEHECQVLDDFQALHKRTHEAEALVLVTPVYWWEMSESAKAFTDRLRRCEALAKENSRMKDHPVILVAAAGGSGNGMITCLASMERWTDHIRARKYDFIPVNRWNKDYKIAAIRAAGETMAREYLAK